jgi:hypothetical protein
VASGPLGSILDKEEGREGGRDARTGCTEYVCALEHCAVFCQRTKIPHQYQVTR